MLADDALATSRTHTRDRAGPGHTRAIVQGRVLDQAIRGCVALCHAPNMRRPAILLALCLLAGALLSACGKGGYVVTAAHPSGTTAAPGTTGATPGANAGAPPTRAQALAFAGAVNLTAADVPGFTPTPKQHSESANERRLEQEFHSCGGAQGAQAAQGSRSTVAVAASPDFELHRSILDLTVSSEVSVARTPAEAAAVLSAVRSARVKACFTRYVSQLLKSQHLNGATVVGVTIASGAPPAPGTTGGFGWRVTATLAAHGLHISFYLDILGFVDGPAQVTLSSSGTVRPFPASAQEQLYSGLLARAKSHSL